MKILTIIFILLIALPAFADNYDRKTDWATGDLITAARLNADPDEVARILGENSDGLLSDGNIKAAAAIAESKISFNASTGHLHDGVNSVIIDHTPSTNWRLGGDTAHTASTTWDIRVTNASPPHNPTVRYQGVDSGAGSWQISNDGENYQKILAFRGTPSANDTTFFNGLSWELRNKTESWAAILAFPDALQSEIDNWIFKAIEPEEFPNGITVTNIYLKTSASSSLAINVENWDDPTTINGSNPTIDAIATSSSTETHETTITYATIGAGQIIMLDLDTTDVGWAYIQINYTVN